MRPITKRNFLPNSYTYKPWRAAKGELISAIGSYCSYCERIGYSSALDVEHIRDKDTHPRRQYLWRNFLLGCKNCNPIKSTKSIMNMYMPHIHNTFEIFTYDANGNISINEQILTSQPQKDKAQSLINLVGLDRRPGHPDYSNKDMRWSERSDAWLLAQKYLPKYQTSAVDSEAVIDLAKAKGFWSIWMTVFQNEPLIVQLLKDEFPGTNL